MSARPQPDALACGCSPAELREIGVKPRLIPHRTFPGNRPSSVILLPKLTPYTIGQLLSLYEHRTAVQGFVWGINSFDQWGVELGKRLATNVRTTLCSDSTRSRGALMHFPEEHSDPSSRCPSLTSPATSCHGLSLCSCQVPFPPPPGTALPGGHVCTWIFACRCANKFAISGAMG